MQKKNSSKPPMDKNERKRGRPAGKNRVPLSLAERRARNAQYERERRNETADAMAQLAEAARCDPQITNPDLLATVINRLQSNQSEKSLEDLKKINDDLEAQIAALEKRLEDPDAEQNDREYRSEDRTTSQSDSDTDQREEERRPTKYRKTSTSSKVHDGTRSTSRKSSRESSADSQDSNLSHHLGKTLPGQLSLEQSQSTVEKDIDLDRTKSSLKEIESKSSKIHYSEEEVYSDCSNHPHSFYDKTHQEVNVEIQLLPEVSPIKTENGTQEQPMDPFTDQEKIILANFGWGEYIDFPGAYTESQAHLSHVDYAGF